MSAIPFAASIACIDKMKKLNTPKMFREMGTKLTEGFKAVSYTHLDVYKRQRYYRVLLTVGTKVNTAL